MNTASGSAQESALFDPLTGGTPYCSVLQGTPKRRSEQDMSSREMNHSAANLPPSLGGSDEGSDIRPLERTWELPSSGEETQSFRHNLDASTKFGTQATHPFGLACCPDRIRAASLKVGDDGRDQLNLTEHRTIHYHRKDE